MTENEPEIIEGTRIERRGHVGIITLCNPGSRNAFYPEMRRRIVSLLDELNGESEIAAIVITGEGEHFCTGADLKALAGRAPKTLLMKREGLKEAQQLALRLTKGPKPTIAAVEGDAFGAGFSIALCCDFIVASASARFGVAFPRMGLIPDLAMMHTLPRRVGLPMARKMFMFGTLLNGVEAGDAGLADEVCAEGEALEAAVGLCAQMESLSPLVLGALKTVLASGPNSVEEALELEIGLAPLMSLSDEHKEAIQAFKEKRAPKFTR